MWSDFGVSLFVFNRRGVFLITLPLPSLEAVLGDSVNGSRHLAGFPRLQLPPEIGPNPEMSSIMV
jgi:hypothetical protein